MGVNTEKQDPNNSDVMVSRVTNEVDLMGYLKAASSGGGGLEIEEYEFEVKNLSSLLDKKFKVYKIGKICFLNTDFTTAASLQSGGYVDICNLNDVKIANDSYAVSVAYNSVNPTEFVGTVSILHGLNSTLRYYIRTSSSVAYNTHICVNLVWECA